MNWIKERLRSFKYAFNGIGLLFEQPNARIHAVVTIIVIVCGIWVGLEAWEWSIVAICIGGVLMAEAFNSAIEALADKISPDYDPLIGKAKDLAAGAVLLIVMGVVTAGLIIFIPKLIEKFSL
ncbi:MAG: diacylglycerol kinase family protein [Muribaculaceae bacterium]|nr:diacylglycerol kinase family protein [Muribaculaceae bacterium]